MYKAVFIDMDGTLLRSDHTVSDATHNTIQKLIAENILVVLVSARPLHGMIPTAEGLGLGSFPLASLNGAYIAIEKEIIFQSVMDISTIQKIHTTNLKGFGATLIYYQQMKWFSEEMNPGILKEQRITKVKVTINSFDNLIQDWTARENGINKIMAVADPGIINSFQNELYSIFDNQLNIYPSKPTYLEIMKQDASKTNAVKFLINKYQIKREEIIALGDNYNDKEMIQFAGTGIAMGNAPDEIKAVADEITDTNNEDGVAKALNRIFKLEN